MELMGFSTRWNFSDAHITARFCTDFSFNTLRSIWFVLKLSCKKIVVFPWIDATHFRRTFFFHFWRHMTANVAISKSSVLFDYVSLPRYHWNRNQCFAGLFLVYWTCRHKYGSFRIVFVVIMELMVFSTRWNFSDAHITARYCTKLSFNTLRRIWFV